MDNQKIAEIFQEIGDILEIQGENKFRVIAYQRAAMIISELPRDVWDIYGENPKDFEKIAGIGKDLAAKIVEIIETKKCKYHQELLSGFPHGLLDMLKVRGVGPKKVKLFWHSLGIDSIAKLRKSAEKGELRKLPGMGEKSEAEILKALGEYDRHTERMLISDAMHEAERIIEYMKKCGAVGRIEYAGSLRRMKETIGDLDFLVTPKGGAIGLNVGSISRKEEAKIKANSMAFVSGKTKTGTGNTTGRKIKSDTFDHINSLAKDEKYANANKKVAGSGSITIANSKIGAERLSDEKAHKDLISKIMNHFIKYAEVADTLAKGDTKTSVILKSGIQCDLRVIDEAVFGAAMHYFTGSKEHNIALRDRAKKMGLKVSEYGVFKLAKRTGAEDKLIAGRTEEDVFKAVGLKFIEPTLRENRGEIEASEKGKLPKVVRLEDLRGDLHSHSKWSDGTQGIEEHALAYMKAGFDYVALTDHSRNLVIANGLTPERYKEQWAEIDELNEKFKGQFTILKGTECDILPDGSLDLPASILDKMDVVIGSVHSSFKMPESTMTARIIKAIESGRINILGHPSGRMINMREPYEVDMEAVIESAAKCGVALEINSQPLRLDLFDYYCRLARDKGCKFAIDSDAHHSSQMAFLRYGVGVAQRGWLEKKDVVNCMPLNGLRKWLNK